MRSGLSGVLFLFCISALVAGQNSASFGPAPGNASLFLPAATGNTTAEPADSDKSISILIAPVTLPRMAPDFALQTYERRSQMQAAQLAAYSATTVIHAELPSTAQQGEYELRRHYAAPRTLEFKPVHFTGDGFVKNNVITRLLQSEVDHLQKDDSSSTAITPANYKFSFKGTVELNDRLVHIYQTKPRKKRVGLFKGRIFLDAYTGALVRAEGSVIKSPSFFVKKIEFVQDYVDYGLFTFPAHMHSDANTRVLGRVIVDIYQRDYQPVATATQTAQWTGGH
jgi:hypothetical protein